MPLQFPSRQHLEVNRQGSSTLVKQMACNGAGRLAADKGARAALHSCHTCVTNAYWARVLVRNAQGMEKGSLDTRISTLRNATRHHFFVKLPKKKELASSSPTDEGCPDQVAKRTTHMGDIS